MLKGFEVGAKHIGHGLGVEIRRGRPAAAGLNLSAEALAALDRISAEAIA
jgi:hypothetical protein